MATGTNVGDSIIIDFDNWTMDDFNAFVNANRNGDFAAVKEYLAKIVVGWSFDSNPGDPAAYGNLTMHNYRAVIKTVERELGEYFAEGN